MIISLNLKCILAIDLNVDMKLRIIVLSIAGLAIVGKKDAVKGIILIFFFIIKHNKLHHLYKSILFT